jgi:hypothetical protein
VGKYGKNCENDYELIMFPKFEKDSFMEIRMTKMEQFTTDDITIQIEFKVDDDNANGLLFYISESIDASGYFISILLRNGFIETR